MSRATPAKTTVLKLRIDPLQKRAFTATAQREGLDVSTWLRRLGQAEVERRRKAAAKR